MSCQRHEVHLPESALLRAITGSDHDEDPNPNEPELDADGNPIESEDDKDKDGEKPKAKDRTYTQAEYDALKARERAADRAKSAAEKKLKDADDAKKTELELAQEKATEAERGSASKDDTITKLRIDNAFLTSNKYSWHNPQRALQIADLSEVTIEEDGTVVGLEAALEKLSKSDPYLLKGKSDDDDDDDKDKSQKPSSGQSFNGQKKTKQPDRKAQERKYSALRGR